MGLIWTELYKIIKKRMVTAALLAVLLFFAMHFWVNVLGEEGMTIQGVQYNRLEAIQKEKELDRQYRGTMTKEKAEAVIERFGWAPDWATLSKPDKDTNDNFWNRYITNELTSWRYDRDSKITWLEETDPAVERFQEQKGLVGYPGGWDFDLLSFLIMAMVITGILTIVGISPVYAEEYALRTADILLSTRYGRTKDIGAKIGAALLWSGGVYVILTGSVLLMTALAYGVEGLAVSSSVSFGTYAYSGTGAEFLVHFLAVGFLACWLNCAVVLWVSAGSRRPFTGVLYSLAIYFLPAAVGNVFLFMLRPSKVVMALKWLCWCTPFYLPVREIDFYSITMDTKSQMLYAGRWGMVLCMMLFCLGVGIGWYRKGGRPALQEKK